jgi:hypothetical protein
MANLVGGALVGMAETLYIRQYTHDSRKAVRSEMTYPAAKRATVEKRIVSIFNMIDSVDRVYGSSC